MADVFTCEVLTRDRKGSTNAVLSIIAVKGKATTLWRPVLRVIGERRCFGTRQKSAVESTRNLLSRISDRMSDAERDRLLIAVQAVHGPSTHGSQPSSPPCVSIIHQIYGVFRDGKQMSRLFENSLHRWRNAAQQMGAQHHLWSADEVDALIQQRYHQFWTTYKDLPFSVMRVDFGRIAILHSYGGLYADLGVYPNRDTYAPASLAVQKVIATGHCKAMKRWLPAKVSKNEVKDRTGLLDMEVLIASKSNPILLRWLHYMCRQIDERQYAKSTYWQSWKLRYIWNTTGPECMTRFLRLKANAEDRSNLKFILSSNNFDQGADLSVSAKRMYDVMSFQSNSPAGDALISPVGDGECPVPVLDGSQPSVRPFRRITRKRKLHETEIVQKQPSVRTHRRTVHPPHTSAGYVVKKKESVVKKEQVVNDQCSQATENSLSDVGIQTVDSVTDAQLFINDLRQHIKKHRKCIATEVFLQDLPAHLRAVYAD